MRGSQIGDIAHHIQRKTSASLSGASRQSLSGLSYAAGVQALRPANSVAGGKSIVQRRPSILPNDKKNNEKRQSAAALGASYNTEGNTYWNAELDDQISRGNEQAIGYAKNIADPQKAVADSELPQLMPQHIGSPSYYEARFHDFNRRHPELTAPDYYLSYGRKYAKIFSKELYGKLRYEGKLWLRKARMLLQIQIENKLLADPIAFDILEKQDRGAGLKKFAYDSHVHAYIDAGLRELGHEDLFQIGSTPGLKDLHEGRNEIARIIFELL